MIVTLTKHHGLGNDFLVLADPVVAGQFTTAERAELARRACDRNRGIGADGLLFALPTHHADAAPNSGTEAIAMRLHNADGSIAEMSGNGIRCFAQAVIDAGVVQPGDVQIATDGGLRIVTGTRSDEGGLAHFRVDMGTPVIGSIPIPSEAQAVIGSRRALTIDVGNPHIVIEADQQSLHDLNIAEFGPLVENPYLSTPSHGINVEVMAPRRAAQTSVKERTDIDMVVWERGVGVTQACGTGSVATAIAAHQWGIIDHVTQVHQPGGAVGVEIVGDKITLIGPSQYICTLTLPFDQSRSR